MRLNVFSYATVVFQNLLDFRTSKKGCLTSMFFKAFFLNVQNFSKGLPKQEVTIPYLWRILKLLNTTVQLNFKNIITYLSFNEIAFVNRT